MLKKYLFNLLLIVLSLIFKLDNNTYINSIYHINNYRYDYLMELSIPSINLNNKIYDKYHIYNDVDKNIMIHEQSSYPDEVGKVILAAHNGNSKVSYFRYLESVNINDDIYITYKNRIYHYKVYDINIVDKLGYIKINKSDNNILILISCKNNTKDKQILYYARLINNV